MPMATALAAAALLGLMTLLATARHGRRRHLPETEQETEQEHPESLTAVLGPGDEEYLAWLADHHWPGDEYLDLESEWIGELGLLEADLHHLSPLCPHCNLRREDVWPCPSCGRLLHPSCGHGMRRRTVDRPYRTHGTESEAVVGEWFCTGCTSVVGLDVDHGDEPDSHLH